MCCEMGHVIQNLWTYTDYINHLSLGTIRPAKTPVKVLLTSFHKVQASLKMIIFLCIAELGMKFIQLIDI